MSAILDALRDYPVRAFAAGETVLEQGARTGLLFVMVDGAVQVVKDGVVAATAAEPGAIFGDLSALLDGPHTASVIAVKASRFHVVANPHELLAAKPAVCLHLCVLLARRLDSLNQYLVNVKQQFAGDSHLGMVEDVLDALIHRQPRQRVAPRASTLRDAEVLD